MTRQQQKLCELMLEFHELCEKKGINYYLIGPQLLHAAQDHRLHGYEMDVAMFLKDWNKLEKWAKKSDRIETESIQDGGNLPGCYFRFVDKNTLLLDISRYGMLAKPGIAIHIHIIRNSRKKEKLLKFLEKGLEDICMQSFSFAGTVVRLMRLFLGRKRADGYMQGLLKTVSAKRANSEPVTELREPRNIHYVFGEGYWDNRTTVVLEGMSLYTAAGYNRYLTQRYGKSWAKRKTDAVKENYKCMFSPILPYERYMTALESGQMITKSFLMRQKKYSKNYMKYVPMRETEARGFERSIFFSGERFRLWKKYMPLKERILSLHTAGRLDEVELMLGDYLTALNKYLKYNMVLCFDKDILNVVKELYQFYGKTAIVAKINKYVRKDDLKPIAVTWKTEDAG